MNQLGLLATYIHDLQHGQLPEDVLQQARWCLLDTLGAALGSARDEEIISVVRHFCRISGSPRDRSASIWGFPSAVPVLQAVFLNGIIGHALEMDDVHARSKTHIGTVVVPAAWALTESRGLKGHKLLTATVAGYETMARIGAGFGVSAHRLRGWHVTGTAGPFGAAAAAGILLGLDKDQMLHALAMAGTQSSGVWAFLGEGASCKKLHPGRAAENGVTAAFLAEAGMTGPSNILDAADGGLYPAMSDAYDMSKVAADLGTVFAISNVDRKLYPCCRSTHSAIDAALQIRRSKGFDWKKIESVQVETYEIGVRQCGSNPCPQSTTEAQFSIPYTVAAAILDGTVTMTQFTTDRRQDDAVCDLARKVTVTVSERHTQAYPEHWGCTLTVNQGNGIQMTERADDPTGSAAKPLSESRLAAKFTALAAPVLGESGADLLAEAVLHLDPEAPVPMLQKYLI